jgi:selenoprotein W-related protein
LNEFKQDISQFVVVPSDGGRFEVTIDGKVVFSKLEEGRFPEEDEIRAHF